MDRQTAKRADAGEASSRTYDLLEVWLDRFEEECGVEEDAGEPLPTDPMECHIKSDGADVVVRGTSSNTALLEASVLKLLPEMQGRQTDPFVCWLQARTSARIRTAFVLNRQRQLERAMRSVLHRLSTHVPGQRRAAYRSKDGLPDVR